MTAERRPKMGARARSLDLAPEKTFYVQFSKKKFAPPPAMKLNGVEIQRAQSVKYLGGHSHREPQLDPAHQRKDKKGQTPDVCGSPLRGEEIRAPTGSHGLRLENMHKPDSSLCQPRVGTLTDQGPDSPSTEGRSASFAQCSTGT